MISPNGSSGKKPSKRKKKIQSEHRIVMRSLTLDDYADVKEIMDIVFPEFDGAWKKINSFLRSQSFPKDKFVSKTTAK